MRCFFNSLVTLYLFDYFYGMKKIIGIFLGLTFIVFAGCSKKSAISYDYAAEESAPMYADSVAAPRIAMSKKMMAASNSVERNFSGNANGSGATVETGVERKLIRNGDISIEVSDLEKTQAAIENWVKEFGGYISGSNNGEKSASYTVRIPSEKFDSAMDAVGSLGTLKNKNISTQDVSDQFYDLQLRLETKKVLRDKLNGYLRQANSMQDILKVESELNSVQSDIESMEGRLKRLTSQIDFSTISVFVSLPYKSVQGGGFELPNLGDGFRHFVSNIISYFGGFVAVIFYVIICGIPLVAVLAFLFWLLFGKIGLLVKLYNKLKK